MNSSYDILPVPKPRMTRSDTWKKRPCVQRYWSFKDAVQQAGIRLAERAHITFVMPMPKSWSKHKRTTMSGMPHQQKPDWDNLGKALSDAVHGEDCYLYDIRVTKIWGEFGQIIIGDLS